MAHRALSVLVLFSVVAALAVSTPAAWGQTEPLRGSVVNKAGKPIEDVRVVLRAPGATDAIQEYTTDTDGLFSIDMASLRRGYEIHLHKDGYDDVTLPISPQQLVMAKISATMLRTRSAPTTTAAPSEQPQKTPKPEWIEDSVEVRERAILLYNEGVKQYEDAEAPEEKQEALLKIRQAASIDPYFAEPLRILCRLAIQQRNWAEASRHAEALIRIDPTDEEAIRDLYVSLIVMQHFKRVGDAARRLVSVDPEKLDYVESHAQEFFKKDNYRMARALFKALTQLSPNDPNAYLNLGICNASLGDTEATRAAFETFLELAPEDHPDIEAVRQELAKLDTPSDPE